MSLQNEGKEGKKMLGYGLSSLNENHMQEKKTEGGGEERGGESV